eukprot:TRINITY_DN94019_c0_g1_i1.p1 TRINITY_DN94019_c0_g1~~TRINITY_DN94019_c0_g1_i1.p1  ORF type:complete len:258 (-),score=51.98 TRINITY_DN94019_c0_g1_i1:170-943(-)
MSFAVEGDEENLPRLMRLRELAGGESSLTPFIRGFEEGGFQEELRQFVAARAPAFKAVCVDGSYPLEWTQYHTEYREMFECHFERMLGALGMTKDEAYSYFSWLQRLNDQFDDDSEDFYSLLDIITSSENFKEFVQVMFAEVRKQEAQQRPREVVWRRLEIEEVEEINVTVPEGVSAGQVLPVHYMGLPYKVTVPDGCVPGMVFSTEITLHRHCEEAYVCAYCHAKFDKVSRQEVIQRCIKRLPILLLHFQGPWPVR